MMTSQLVELVNFDSSGLIIAAMNHFAHCVLAQASADSVVGNLLGDFARGLQLDSLQPAVRAGLDNHRAVDRFTDSHPLVVEMKRQFSQRRRRFAGIALDIYFDHLLIKHWQNLEEGSLEQTIDSIYGLLREAHASMPNQKMQRTTQTIVEHDWFGSYRHIDGIAHAIVRVAARIRFPNAFDNAIEDLLANHKQIEAGFIEFYPQLKAHIAELGLES